MSSAEGTPRPEQFPTRDLLHHPYCGQKIKPQKAETVQKALQNAATRQGATLTQPEEKNGFIYTRHLTENQQVVKADAGENVPLTATNIYDAEGFLLRARLDRHTTVANVIPTVERVYHYSEVDTEGFKTVTGIDIYVKDAAGNMTLVTQKRVGPDGKTQEKSFPANAELGTAINNVMSAAPIPNKIDHVDSLLEDAQKIAAKDQTGMVRFNQTSPTTAEVVVLKPVEMANISPDFGHNYFGDYMSVRKMKAEKTADGQWRITEIYDDMSLWASTEEPKPYNSQRTTYSYRPDGLLDSNTTELDGKRTVTEKYMYNRQLQLSSGQEIQVFDTNHVYYDEEGQYPAATGSFTFLNDVLLPSRFAYANPQARNNLGVARQGFSDVILENKLIRIIPLQASGKILIVTLQLDTKGEIVRDPADTYFTINESGTIVPQKAATVELIG